MSDKKRILSFLVIVCSIGTILAMSAAVVEASSDLDVTIKNVDRLQIELKIGINLRKVGFQEGNVTRLFVLSEAIDNLPFPPSFQVSEVTSTGIPVPVQTRQVYESYIEGVFASSKSFEGFEFYFDSAHLDSSYSEVVITSRLEVTDNLGLFLRLSSEGGLWAQNYPLDQYAFGLGILVFNKDSNASVSIAFPDSISYASTSPLVPASQSTYFSLSLTGYGRLDLWNLDSEKVSEYATPNIVVTRNEFELTFVPMLLIISFLLLVPIMIFASRNKQREFVTVFLALVVLDIGIFERLGNVEWLVWTPSMLAVLDLVSGTALIICALLLAGKDIRDQPNPAEKQGLSKTDLARNLTISFILVVRVIFGNMFGQFQYIWSATAESLYLLIGVLVLFLAFAITLVYVTGNALYKNRESIISLLRKLKNLLKTTVEKTKRR